MVQKSMFSEKGYEGYKVRLKLIREGYQEYSPIAIGSSDDVYEFMKDLRHFDRERFYSICLDGRNQIVQCEEISSGTPEHTVAHPREVFKSAILSSSSSIVLAHNHPSGDPKPSIEDFMMTERFYECADLLVIRLLDHVIIGADSYYSFRDSGDLAKLKKKSLLYYLFCGD